MWLLFVPILLIVVLVFLVASLFAGVAWMLGAGWPWLLIGLGVWLFWHQDGRHRSRRGRRGWDKTARPAASGTRPDKKVGRRASAVQAAPLMVAETLHGPQLPADVQLKIEGIRQRVDALLGYADRFPPFSQDLYLVRQTASDYLPRTIDAYLALPRQTVDQPLVSGGKTAHQELAAQLDLLTTKLDDIAHDLDRQDSDRLLANRSFLESRFGTHNEPLKFTDSATTTDVA